MRCQTVGRHHVKPDAWHQEHAGLARRRVLRRQRFKNGNLAGNVEIVRPRLQTSRSWRHRCERRGQAVEHHAQPLELSHRGRIVQAEDTVLAAELGGERGELAGVTTREDGPDPARGPSGQSVERSSRWLRKSARDP